MITGSLKELYKLFRRDRAPVAFVGSGLSRNYVPWDQFVLKLAQRSDNTSSVTWLENEIAHDSPNHPLTEELLAIARESKRKLDSSNALAEFMNEEFTRSSQVPDVYEALVRAPFAFYITTNYDNNIERAWEECHGSTLKVLTFKNCDEVLLRIATGQRFVFKLHGCAEAGGEFVISDEDYKKIIHNRAEVRLTLSTVFAAHPVVFMGYGHRDPHISNHLLDHRAILEGGGQEHFTFVKKGADSGYSIPSMLRALYGIASVEISDWSSIKEIVSQLSYVRLGDRSASVRLENHAHFEKFTESGDIKSAWGAMLFAAASSEIGRGEAIPRLVSAIEKSGYLKEKVASDDGLKAIYLLVAGQYQKRGGFAESAEEKYKELENLCRESQTIIPTLKSKGIRYAGTYWLAHDESRGLALLDEAEKLAAKADTEEEINAKKWVLVASKSSDAPEKLLKLANYATEQGFVKSAAWCKFGAAKLTFELGGSLTADIKNHLCTALLEFESLDHLQGVAECNVLLVRATIGEDSNEVQKSRLELSSSIAKMCGLKSTERAATRLINQLAAS